MQLHDQEALVGHRVEIAVEAVDHHDRGLVLDHRDADLVHEFAGRQFPRIDWLHRGCGPTSSSGRMSMPMPAQRVRSVLMLSSKMNSAAHSPRSRGRQRELHATVDLPVPGAPTNSVLVPFSMPPPSRSSSAAMPLGNPGLRRPAAMCSDGDQAREHLQAAADDLVVVVAAAEVRAAVLDHHQPAARRRRSRNAAAPAGARRARCSAPAGRGRSRVMSSSSSTVHCGRRRIA